MSVFLLSVADPVACDGTRFLLPRHVPRERGGSVNIFVWQFLFSDWGEFCREKFSRSFWSYVRPGSDGP